MIVALFSQAYIIGAYFFFKFQWIRNVLRRFLRREEDLDDFSLIFSFLMHVKNKILDQYFQQMSTLWK